MLLATRLGVGIGEAVCTPAATNWIGDLVPPNRRARAMAALHDGRSGRRNAELRHQRPGGAAARLAHRPGDRRASPDWC